VIWDVTEGRDRPAGATALIPDHSLARICAHFLRAAPALVAGLSAE
jgi:hypothetical protein